MGELEGLGGHLGRFDRHRRACQRTGSTPARVHFQTSWLSSVIATIRAVVRAGVPDIFANQAATFAVSALTGRVSLTLVYFIRPGSWWMKALLPPSSRCSMVTSTPIPSQAVKVPSGHASISTLKQTLTAGSALGSAISHPSEGQCVWAVNRVGAAGLLIGGDR